MGSTERGAMKTMLSVLKDDIEDKYFDPDFKGIDLDAKYDEAKSKLESAATVGQALSIIAQFFLDFDDSHLFFLPPATNLEVEYGYRTRMIGDKCIVTTVKPKSDAEKKGLSAGDQILAVEGFRTSRKDLWKINYFFRTLSKRGQLKLAVLKQGAAAPNQLVIRSKVKKKPAVITRQSFFRLFEQDAESAVDRHLFLKFGYTAYWKIPNFSSSPNVIDRGFDKVGDANNLILDLRGNGGGALTTLERLASYVFDKELLIATPKGRKDFDPAKSKSKGRDAFKGKLIVLIDSASGSASEIFARIVQIEERGVVLGDVSSGAVMMSKRFISSMRNDAIFYGASITIADLVMPDGQSLENVGVTPNKMILPTPSDMANNRDPVLSEALALFNVSVSPEEAGSMFVYKWHKNNSVSIEFSENKN